MTALQFYKWIKEWTPEYRWEKRNDKQDVLIWISIISLPYLTEILSYSLFDEGGIEVRWQENYIAVWAGDILDHYGIELEEVFTIK